MRPCVTDLRARELVVFQAHQPDALALEAAQLGLGHLGKGRQHKRVGRGRHLRFRCSRVEGRRAFVRERAEVRGVKEDGTFDMVIFCIVDSFSILVN